MEALTTQRNDHWLKWIASLYLLCLILWGPSVESIQMFRWVAFFLVAQLLFQIIFPQFRASRGWNIAVAVVIISWPFLNRSFL